MKHKSLVATLVAGAIVSMGLTACTNDTGTPAGGSTTGGGSTTITLGTLGSEKPGPEQVVAAFKKQNPGVDVKIEYTGVDEYQTLMRTKLSAGTAPDVFFTWPGDGNSMAMKVVQRAGLLMDLSDQPFVSGITDSFKPLTSVAGKTYLAPVTAAGIGAAYNMTALKAAKLTVPTTWTQVLKFCSDAKAKGKTAFALAVATNWQTQLIPYALTPTLVYGPQPDFAQQMSDGKVKFKSSKWKDAFDKYLQMQNGGCFQKNDLGTVYEDALSMVAKGQALSSVQVNSSMAAIESSAPKGSVFSLQPFPATDDASQTRVALAAGSSYAVNAKTKQKDAAVKLASFFASKEGSAIYAKASSAMPAIPNPSFKVNPSLGALAKYAKEQKGDPFMDQLWPNAKVQQVHLTGLQLMLAGKESPDKLLDQMDKAYAEGSSG